MSDFCLIFSAILTLGTLAFWLISRLFSYYRRKTMNLNFWFFGVFSLAAIFIFFPICHTNIAENNPEATGTFFLTILSSVHSTIRLFVVDGDFQTILDYSAKNLEDNYVSWYNWIAAILHVICPILTATGIASLFCNFTAYIRYCLGWFKNTYIFSELNDRSIKLARSLKTNDPKRMIVFTDVFNEKNEKSYELIERAQEIDAVLFKSDITVINFRFHYAKTNLYFFVIGSDDSENINQAISLSKPKANKKEDEKYTLDYPQSGYDYERKGGDTRVYLFTVKESSEYLLSSIDPQFLKLRRINEVQSLIYKLLYDEGHYIFHSAVESGNMLANPLTGEPTPEKQISAVILGLGLHGTELLKALPWFCQLYPYRVKITVFDKEKNAESRFLSHCPELLAKGYNGNFDTDGEAHYSISINPDMPEGCDVTSSEFDRAIEKLTDTTYVIVALGNDDLNIQIAAKIRILLKRNSNSTYPFIHAIVYNPDKQLLLNKGSTANGIMYDIHPTGDTVINYSESCIIGSELEKEAERRHTDWVERKKELLNWDENICEIKKKAFWKYDYNYRSSLVSVIHKRFKNKNKFIIGNDAKGEPIFYEHQGVPGADLPAEERKGDKYKYLGKMEHQRWNAYMRSEGYVHVENGKLPDHLYKTHHCLVAFDKVDSETQKNDIDSF